MGDAFGFGFGEGVEGMDRVVMLDGSACANV